MMCRHRARWAMAGKIFINYRRGDDPGNTGRLFDRLQEAFQPEQLFMDVDSIAPGLDFVRVLEEQVGQCDALLAVIGKKTTRPKGKPSSARVRERICTIHRHLQR
jgi:hypothetical protein